MKWCQKSPKIVIFKGDDTNFPGNGVIYFELDSEMSFEGLSAHFEFLGVKRTWDEIPSDKKLAISFTNEETSGFPNGAACAELWLENSEGKKRTIANNIEIVTTSNVDLAYKCIDDKIINVSIVGAHIPEDLFRLEGKVDELTIKVNQLETDLNGYKQSVDGLGTFVGQMAGQLNSTTATANKNKQDIAGLDTRIEEIENELAGGGGGGVSTLMVETTYAQLKSLIQSGSLVPGMQYRITDYAYVPLDDWFNPSGNHPFDIIVTADSANSVNEEARAIRRAGDTYYRNANLEAWKVWYSIENDDSRFEWANPTQGKGVIYRLIDEFGNDVPYDFKNVLINKTPDSSPDYYYTFSDGAAGDSTVSMTYIASNVKIGYSHYNSGDNFIKAIPNVIFHQGNVSNVTVGHNCLEVFIAGNTNNVTIGDECIGIDFKRGASYIDIGINCENITLHKKVTDAKIGDLCKNVNLYAFLNTRYVRIGMNCSNILVNGEKNIIGDGCSNITIGSATSLRNGVTISPGLSNVPVDSSSLIEGLALFI